MRRLLAVFSVIISLFWISLLWGNAPTPAADVPARCESCDCGCNEGLPCLCCAVAPDRKDVEPKKDAPPPKEIPQIIGESIWGDIGQNGMKIDVQGHAQWYVDKGEIRADGKLLLLWVHRHDGETGPGLYTMKADGEISGFWNWSKAVTTDKDGTMHGLTQPDTLRAKLVFD